MKWIQKLFPGRQEILEAIGDLDRRLDGVVRAMGAIDGAATAVTASAAIVRNEASKITTRARELPSAAEIEDLNARIDQLVAMIAVMREYRDVSQDLKNANAGVDRILRRAANSDYPSQP